MCMLSFYLAFRCVAQWSRTECIPLCLYPTSHLQLLLCLVADQSTLIQVVQETTLTSHFNFQLSIGSGIISGVEYPPYPLLCSHSCTIWEWSVSRLYSDCLREVVKSFLQSLHMFSAVDWDTVSTWMSPETFSTHSMVYCFLLGFLNGAAWSTCQASHNSLFSLMWRSEYFRGCSPSQRWRLSHAEVTIQQWSLVTGHPQLRVFFYRFNLPKCPLFTCSHSSKFTHSSLIFRVEEKERISVFIERDPH